jgi:hypothetical protein
MCKISTGSAGSFLSPPKHPNYTLHIECFTVGRMSCSMEYAYDNPDQICASIRSQVRQIVERYNQNIRTIAGEEALKTWIVECMKYFKNCYSFDGSWNADKLTINRMLLPTENQQFHAGVHYIRKYLPDFNLTEEYL